VYPQPRCRYPHPEGNGGLARISPKRTARASVRAVGGGLFIYCTADFSTTLPAQADGRKISFGCDRRSQRLGSLHGSHGGSLRFTVPMPTRFVLPFPCRLAPFFGFHAGLLNSMDPTATKLRFMIRTAAARFVPRFLQPICEQSLQVSTRHLRILMLGTPLLLPSLLLSLAPFCLRVDECQGHGW
jgi:hypothetical protein